MDENLTPQDQGGQAFPPQSEMPPMPQPPQPEVPDIPPAPQPNATVTPPRPQAPEQDYVQPVQQQYYQQNQSQMYGSETSIYFKGYFDALLCFFKDTGKFVNTLLDNQNKMWMFLGLNIVLLFTSVLAIYYSFYTLTIKMYNKAFGFLSNTSITVPWGDIIKSSIIFCVVFVVFLAIMSLMISISKKGKENNTDFIKGLSFSSILSVTIPYFFAFSVFLYFLADMLIGASGLALLLLSLFLIVISIVYIYSILVFVETLRDKVGFTALKGVINLVLALYISGFVFGFISGITGNKNTVSPPSTNDIFKTNSSNDFDNYK